VIDVPEQSYGQISTTETALVAEVTPTSEVEGLVRDYFSDIPILAEVARCESTFRHTLDDGSVLRGRVDPRDTGVMQINTYYHQATAEAMGLDIEDFYHNMVYARHLYETQ